MFQQQNTMLLTVVELIFALLVSFFLVVYLSLKPANSVESERAKTVEEYRIALEDVKKELEFVKKKSAIAKTDLENFKKGLKSKQTPSCIEKGLAKGPLAEITILGINNYAVRGKEYGFQVLRALFEDDIGNARRAGCIHSVNVSADKHLTSQEYDEGLRKLEQLFYVKRLKVR